MKTEFKTIDEMIEKNEDAPLTMDVIPNHMGINLCSVEGMSWTKQEDGQLVSLTIHFIPTHLDECDDDIIDKDGNVNTEKLFSMDVCPRCNYPKDRHHPECDTCHYKENE